MRLAQRTAGVVAHDGVGRRGDAPRRRRRRRRSSCTSVARLVGTARARVRRTLKVPRSRESMDRPPDRSTVRLPSGKCTDWNTTASQIGPLYVQGSAKEWSLGCVKRARAARGGQDVGITQPRDHSLADPCFETKFEK